MGALTIEKNKHAFKALREKGTKKGVFVSKMSCRDQFISAIKT